MINLDKKFQLLIVIWVFLLVIVVPHSESYAQQSPKCAIPQQGPLPFMAKNISYVGDVKSIMHGNCNAYASLEDDAVNPEPAGHQPCR